MDAAHLLQAYGTSLVAAGIALVALLGLTLARNRELRRGLLTTVGAMVLFILLRLARTALAREVPDAARYLELVGLVVFAWGALSFLSAIVFDLLPRRATRPPTPRILRQVAFGVVFAILVVGILRSVMRVDLTGVLATSAVLSLVLGLALQDTLGNLFAGLSLQAEKPFEVGDWVTFGTFAGRVVQVGWRTTQIEDFARDLVSVPNNVIARESVTNHSRPDPVTGVRMDLGLSYSAPPNEVKRVVLDVLDKDPRVRHEPEPIVRLTTFGDSAVQYMVRFWVDEFELRSATLDAVTSALWYRLRREGIEIPFPMRTVQLRTEDAAERSRAAEEKRARIEALLSRTELLAPLGPEGQKVLAERGREVTFGGGEIVFREGEPGTACYLVLEGEAHVVTTDGAAVGSVGPGEIFGEGALLTGDPRIATMQAGEDTVVLEIDRAAFREVLLANEQVAHELAAILERRRAARRAAGQAPAGQPSRPANGDTAGLLRRIRDIFGLDR